MRARGFTLLEVLVAVSILGLGLTVILSSQVGLFSSAQRAENLTVATNLARCKMSETELYLLENGYPLIDRSEEGDCCEDDPNTRYSCQWDIERIELPQPAGMNLDDSDGGLDLAVDGGAAAGGPLGGLAALQQGGTEALGGDAGLASMASLMGAGSDSGAGLASMAMGLVYPTLKPMLEASIRKVTVTVRWKEGVNQREFALVQFVTDPQQGGLDADALELPDGGLLGSGSGQPGESPSSGPGNQREAEE